MVRRGGGHRFFPPAVLGLSANFRLMRTRTKSARTRAWANRRPSAISLPWAPLVFPRGGHVSWCCRDPRVLPSPDPHPQGTPRRQRAMDAGAGKASARPASASPQQHNKHIQDAGCKDFPGRQGQSGGVRSRGSGRRNARPHPPPRAPTVCTSVPPRPTRRPPGRRRHRRSAPTICAGSHTARRPHHRYPQLHQCTHGRRRDGRVHGRGCGSDKEASGRPSSGTAAAPCHRSAAHGMVTMEATTTAGVRGLRVGRGGRVVSTAATTGGASAPRAPYRQRQ